MITRILDFCIRERLVITMACLGIVAYGWYSTQYVPRLSCE